MERAWLKLVAVACLSALGCATAGSSGPGPALSTQKEGLAPRARELRALVEPLLADEWVHSLAVGVIDGAARGVERFGSEAGEGPTLYEVGSISKLFTAVTLAVLVERGLVRLDEPLSHLLPGAPEAITLEGLATHTSGLPALPGNLTPADPSNPYADYTEADLSHALAEFAKNGVGRRRFEYSNFGFGVLGHALARRMDSPYALLVKRELLEPLAMNATTVSLGADANAVLVQGHDADGNAVGAWDFAALAPAGGWRSSIDDMLRFLHANIELRDDSLGRALRATHLIGRAIPGEPRTALGWLATDEGWLWHNGETAGAHAFIAFSPESKRGVVILADTATRVIDELGMAIMRVLHNREPAFAVPRTVVLSRQQLERLVGRYVFAPGLEIVLERRGSALYATLSHQGALRLYPESVRRLSYRAVDARVEILTDVEGRACGLQLHQAGTTSTAKRADYPEAGSDGGSGSCR